MSKIRFTRPESWTDYRGKTSVVLIFDGKEEIGKIHGFSSNPGSLDWDVEIRGEQVGRAFNITDARKIARKHLGLPEE